MHNYDAENTDSEYAQCSGRTRDAPVPDSEWELKSWKISLKV
jgi:hypothetical protein